MLDPTQRFSSRVENYVKYRPGYPPAIIDLLKAECGLTRDSIVADIGSGTGLLTELFLKNGNRVFGVEPNREMREAGAKSLRRYPNFTSIAAAAEATMLDDQSIDLITAGQAFHWFDRAKVPIEFARILKPAGWIALVWNERKVDATPFMQTYEQLLQTYATGYEETNHRQVDLAAICHTFQSDVFKVAAFDNSQVFDYAGLKGRLLSSSYAPEAGHPLHTPMLERLAEIFKEHQSGGVVRFDYETHVYYGRLLNR